MMQTLIICKGCAENKPHQAKGYCRNCYHKFIVRKTGGFDKNDPEIYQQHLAVIKQKVSTKMKEQWGQEQRIVSKLSKEHLEDLYCTQKMSMGDIAKLYNCSRVYVMMLLRKHSLPVRTKSAARGEAKKKGKNVGFSAINEDFFKNQSPEMAYVLGFIYADGNLGNQLDQFSISQKEPEILYKIKDLMSSEHKVVRQKNQELYTLTIGNKTMINDLISLGLTPNKSLDVRFPVLDTSLYGHFIRGYFDGDGSICFLSKGWRISFVSGSNAFLKGLREALSNHIGTSIQTIHSSSSSRAYQLYYFRNSDLIKIFNFFYDDPSLKKMLFLHRKYEMFLRCFDQKGEQQFVGAIEREKSSISLVIAFLNRYVGLVSDLKLKENAQKKLCGLLGLQKTIASG